MTLQDISHGPGWIMWGVFLLFAVLSIVLLSGRGANLIAGYNTASHDEKAGYDEKKLCRITGAGMAVITVLLFVMAMWSTALSAAFVYVFLSVTLIVCAAIVILANTVCRK